MNANEMTFGIEIETIAPDSAVQNDGLRIGPYRRGIQVPYLPAGWKAEADGSIDSTHVPDQLPREKFSWLLLPDRLYFRRKLSTLCPSPARRPRVRCPRNGCRMT